MTDLAVAIQWNPVGAALVVLCVLVLAPLMVRDARQWWEARGVGRAETKR